MKSLTLYASMFLLATACGDDDDDGIAAIDAATADAPTADASGAADANVPDAVPGTPDATSSSVEEVPCASATVSLAVTTQNGVNKFSFSKTPEIAPTQVVDFTMSSSHNAISGAPGNADGKFRVELGQHKCFRFTQVGSYPFFCGPHGFTGTISVIVN